MFRIIFCSRMFGVYVWVVYFLLLFTFTKGSVVPQELKNPAKDFSRYRLVQPTLHHGRTKRELSSTRDTNGAHHPEVTMTVDVEGQDYVLDLQLNEDLVAGDHTISYQEGGKNVLHKPKKQDLDLCHYSGSVRGIPGSWVALSTCNGVRGAVYDGKKMRFIEPADGGDIQSNHYLYDHNDLNTNYRCGNEDGVTNNTMYDSELMGRYQAQQDLKRSRVSRYKRNTDDTQVRGSYNVNKETRYVELVLVADHKGYLVNGKSVEAVHAYMLQVANILNLMYLTLNVYIALVGVVVWSERDEINLEEGHMLSDFASYRERLVLDSDIDIAQLLTHQPFPGNTIVGLGYVGTACNKKYSVGVSYNYTSVIGAIALTIAHEMGHNLDMGHDDSKLCECPNGNCVMGPSYGPVAPYWSSCSSKSLADFLKTEGANCLRNKPKRLADSPTCGNGFLELGEQCDCGPTSAERCRACCHHDTCMLRSNATCATGVCCDLMCQVKAAGTVCRSADQECDLPEYCTGHSEFCPDDVFKMDTLPCGVDKKDQMCMNQRCVPKEEVKETLPKVESSVCPSNCSGHGVCNSLGHCHCEPGYGPPVCAVPGPGGSYDSGPASDRTGQRNFMITMYVIFVCMPTMLILSLFYHSRHTVLLWWKQPRQSYVDYFNCRYRYKHTINHKFQSLRNTFGKRNDELISRPNGKINEHNNKVLSPSESKSSHSMSKFFKFRLPTPNFQFLRNKFGKSKELSSKPIGKINEHDNKVEMLSESKSPHSVSNFFKVRLPIPNLNKGKNKDELSSRPVRKIKKDDIQVVTLSESKSPPMVSQSPSVYNCSKVQNNTILKNNVEAISGNSKQFSKDAKQQTLSASKSTTRNGNSFDLVNNKEELSDIRSKLSKIVKDDIRTSNTCFAKNNEEQICLETKKKQLRKVNKDQI